MTFLKKLFISIILGFALPSFAFAAGLGRMTVQSGLGQPLQAEIEVVALQPGEADTLAVALASIASFRQANIEYTSALQTIRFAIERRPNNQYVISLSSIQPMNEPFLDMLVELTWSAGRLVREYTFLLDPPELKPTASAPTPPVTPPVVTSLVQDAPKPPVSAPPAATASPQIPSSAGLAPLKPSAKPAAIPAGQYEVKRGDTLGKIASQNMVAGASLQQMLTALYRGNEDAFDGKNMNRLRTGRILNLPAAGDIQGISQNEAFQLVRSQASDFREFQQSIGAAVTAAPERAEGSRQAAGRISAPAADKPAAKAAAKDQLRLSKPDDAKGAGRSAAAATADDLAAKDNALREATERIALLEKNVQDLQKLLQIKSGGGAQAQKQAEAGVDAKAAPAKAPVSPAKAETPAAPAVKSDAAKVPAEAAKAAPETAKSAEAPKPAAPASPEASKAAAPDGAKPVAPDAAKGGEPVKPAAEVGAAPDVAKAAPKPASKAPPPPPPPPQSFVDELLDNELAVGGAGGVAILLAGYAAYAWRRKKKAASADFGDNVVSAAPVAAASIASSSIANSEPVSATGDSSQSASGGGEEIDPIAEADVYMAYGRDTQAEEILKDALSKDVNRTPVWLKLLEVYANRKDLKTFESTARDLQTLCGGKGPDWEKAQALGLQLDPGNALYGGSGATGNADLASTQIMPGADFAADSDATMIPDAAMSAAAEAAPAVDFDLNLGDTPAQETAAAVVDLDLGAPPTAGEASQDQAGGGLDFDLGLGGDKPAAEAPSDFTPLGTLIIDSTAAPAVETVSAPDDGGASIDFDLDMPTDVPAEAPAESPSPAAVATADATGDSGSTMDFNLNLDDALAVPEVSPSASTDIDLSALSLDLGPDDASAAAAPMDAKWQEVATKLDLAKAYDEMGDKDGARDLLNEVMQEGDAAQKQQAQTMINALA
ncbi:MAG: hypothetical protein EXR28_17065 [Betaproteobacteria bacterium]|nr:hypothetical protein [Betaproteobacteria bacterium]